jgi:hypothetical protein
MLIICCTGAHLLPNTGKENRLPTTATAQKTPAIDNFLMFIFVSLHSSISLPKQDLTPNDRKRWQNGSIRTKQSIQSDKNNYLAKTSIFSLL